MMVALSNTKEYKVWCEPVSRGDLKLGPGDIQDAITQYINATATAPSAILINRKNEKYAGEAGDIPVIVYPSVMLWDIWIAGGGLSIKIPGPSPVSGKDVLPPAPKAHEAQQDAKKPVAKIKEVYNHTPAISDNYATPLKNDGRGRPRAELPDKEILKMFFEKGISARRITEILAGRGIEVNHVTISRRINLYMGKLI